MTRGACYLHCRLLSAGVLNAHAGEPLQPHDLWTPGDSIPASASRCCSQLFFMRGASAKHARSPFLAGMLLLGGHRPSLAAGLVSPLHPLGKCCFSAHMIQHEILMLVAAPLLVLSRPLVPHALGPAV